MAGILHPIPFTAELLDRVQSFDCGTDAIWQTELSDWLKAPAGGGGAVDALTGGTQVWVYVNEAGELVGFGSLGAAMQRWPGKKDPPISVSVIPFLAVDRRFWGQPPGPPEGRYSAVILRHLYGEALRYRDSRPVLKLYVYEGNQAAIKLYGRMGFKELHKPYVDKRSGLTYKRMALLLTDPPTQG